MTDTSQSQAPAVSVLDVIQAVCALLPRGVSWRIGPEHRGESIAPPRVVWIPASDTFSAPVNHGGRGRRPVWTVESSWEVILLAKGDDRTGDSASFRALESLRDAVINAVWETARGNAEILSGRFDEQDDSAISRFGRAYTLTIRFSLEVSPSAFGRSDALLSSATVTGTLGAPQQ
jgi:hypothetical protein